MPKKAKVGQKWVELTDGPAKGQKREVSPHQQRIVVPLDRGEKNEAIYERATDREFYYIFTQTWKERSDKAES